LFYVLFVDDEMYDKIVEIEKIYSLSTVITRDNGAAFKRLLDVDCDVGAMITGEHICAMQIRRVYAISPMSGIGR